MTKYARWRRFWVPKQMPESDLHKRLVTALASLVRKRRSSSWFLFVDSGVQHPSDGCSPILGCARPDVYARENVSHHVIIGEAKTACDLDNSHTERQLFEYFRHLSGQQS